MIRLITSTLFICLFASCATHTGNISSSSINRTVKYEDIALGVSQTNNYFGIGGLSQDAMVLEAKRELIKNRPLGKNEEYANFTIDFKNSYILFYNQTKLTMSADVIRFVNDSINEPYSEKYKNKLLGKIVTNNLFNIGDSIIDNHYKKGVIIEISNKDAVRILYKTKTDKIQTKKIATKNIFSISKNHNGYSIGEMYKGIMWDEKVVNGKIIAVGLNSFIVKVDINEYKTIPYQSSN